MENPSDTIPNFGAKLVFRVVVFILVFPLILIAPSGTFQYWQAWMYFGCILIVAIPLLVWFYRTNPGLLAKRMRFKEKREPQKKIILLGDVILLLVFIIPGLDIRFGWSDLPDWVCILAECFALAGYGLIIRVFAENQYASRVVEVNEGQMVISSGPYSVVRHPMYLGSTIFYLFTPIALGSLWALMPALLVIPMLVARIIDEEALLRQELPGYNEYTAKVRYRLLPGIW